MLPFSRCPFVCMSAFVSLSQFAMNHLQHERECVMIALLAQALIHVPPHVSRKKDTAGHEPCKTEKRYLGSTFLLRGIAQVF